MRMLPEKKRAEGSENAIPIVSEKGSVFGLDPPSEEQERIWYYHNKLVFKDGKSLVRVPSIS